MPFVLSVPNEPFMLSVVMPSAINICVVMLSVLMVSFLTVSVVMLNVIMLNVMSPTVTAWCHTQHHLKASSVISIARALHTKWK